MTRVPSPIAALALVFAFTSLHAQQDALPGYTAAGAAAQRALEVLGAHDPEPFVEREMMEQFSRVALAVPDGPDREVRLRAALRTVLQDYDDV